MQKLYAVTAQSVALALMLTLAASTVFTQSGRGSVHGRVVDQAGAALVGVRVRAVREGAEEVAATSDGEGHYTVDGLSPGNYTVHASTEGFAPFDSESVEVKSGQASPVNIALAVALETQSVEVQSESGLSLSADANAGALVITGKDLDSLPDDPDQLAAALRALAGPSAGPDGGQIFIDGFAGGRLPSKNSIGEIRVNQNPFSAEYDRFGLGRIEIITKPGSDSKYRGQGFFNFNDESLNTRNPFTARRASSQSHFYGGSLSGPVVAKRASFFLDFQRREIDENAVVNATILGPGFGVTRFDEAVGVPQRLTTFSPRFDWQIDQNHTLMGRYNFARLSADNQGVGELSLASRAYASSETNHTLQLSFNSVLNYRTLNETRFQFIRSSRDQNGDNSLPTVQVLDSFTGGGSQIGRSSNEDTRWELYSAMSWMLTKHYLKAGVRLRGADVSDVSPVNFGGTYVFSGGLAPRLDADDRPVLDTANGQPVLVPITSIESYRRTLLFQQRGLTSAEIRALGGGAALLVLSAGDPQASVRQFDVAPFVQDEWRLRSNLTMSFGLRYERQNNAGRGFDFAPRFGVAWAPGAGARQPKTVVRAGIGLFYDRIGEGLTLQANRFDGTTQQQFVVSPLVPGGGALLDSYPSVPGAAALAGFTAARTMRVVAPDIRSPYTIQSSVSVERQMPYKVTLTTTFVNTRTLHALRSRDITAGTTSTTGRIYQFESSGRLDQNQLIVNANKRVSKDLSFFSTYVLGKAEGDTDGPYSIAADPSDFRSEYGRSPYDVRHRFTAGGYVRVPLGVSLNPFVIASTGRPFNITTGQSTFGDANFTARPALASDLSRPGVVVTPFGAFDPNPAPGTAIIPRNYGQGPSFFSVNLDVSRDFLFGKFWGGGSKDQSAPTSSISALLNGKGTSDKTYVLTVTARFQNLFNHTNPGMPVGSLGSPFFGQSMQSLGAFGTGTGTSAGNRRIEAQIRLSF